MASDDRPSVKELVTHHFDKRYVICAAISLIVGAILVMLTTNLFGGDVSNTTDAVDNITRAVDRAGAAATQETLTLIGAAIAAGAAASCFAKLFFVGLGRYGPSFLHELLVKLRLQPKGKSPTEQGVTFTPAAAQDP